MHAAPQFNSGCGVLVLKLFAAVLMQVELSSLLDAVQETETQMVEMSALNHLMSTHILQQAQQIELLYEQVRIHFVVCIFGHLDI